jgi:ribonuclease I
MGRKEKSAHAPGDFDLYLLAQTWAPHFCCQNADRCHTVPWSFSARHLALHGLWPGFAQPRGGETFPQNCSFAGKLATQQLPREYIDVAPSFTTWNPTERRAEVGSLARHEWKKHGTCTGLAPDKYFSEELRALSMLPGDRGTPTLLSQHVGGDVRTTDLRGAYPRRVGLRADEHCRLVEVTSCWEKLADGRVGKQCDCPEHVMRGRDSTSCATLRVTQLGQCLKADAEKSQKNNKRR